MHLLAEDTDKQVLRLCKQLLSDLNWHADDGRLLSGDSRYTPHLCLCFIEQLPVQICLHRLDATWVLRVRVSLQSLLAAAAQDLVIRECSTHGF